MTCRPPRGHLASARTRDGQRPAFPRGCRICPIPIPLHHPWRVNTRDRLDGTVKGPGAGARADRRDGRHASRQGGTKPMSTPTRPAVDDTTAAALTALALGRTDVLEQAEDLRERLRESSGLDPRGFSLVKIAALVAL